MNICFFTNTFLPHVGGVARSAETFLQCFRKMRHRVLVVAPEFAEGPAPRKIERVVERVPAIQHFNGSDFSVRLPLGTVLSRRLEDFPAQIIHAHHPLLLGDTALRIAASRRLPVVFTHHTLYEQYTHYVPFHSEHMRDFVIELATRFANRCHGVIAPSRSLAELIQARGVIVPVRVVPTGIDTKAIASGKRSVWRKRLDLTDDAVVVGHVGRLAEEKNLGFLADAAARALARCPHMHLLVVGGGPARKAMEELFDQQGVASRTHFLGPLTGKRLHHAYAAMDVFAFASHSETQGLVLAEAMAAHVPVIALDANGVREVVEDHRNGRLLAADATPESMARVLVDAAEADDQRAAWAGRAAETAAKFDSMHTAREALKFYHFVLKHHRRLGSLGPHEGEWEKFLDRIAVEGRLFADKLGAITRAWIARESARRTH